MKKKKVIICGLPESGKTTFLAALWYLLTMNESNTSLKLKHMPECRDYLNNLSRKWSRFVEFDRTPTDEFQEISLNLLDNDKEIELLIPDMSGETWRDVWAIRTLNKKNYVWAKEEANLMLFIHVDNYYRPPDIVDHKEMLASAGQKATEGPFVEWSPDDSPTQVILVDILQVLGLPPIGNKGKRLAIILSAWDKAEDAGKTPEQLLERDFPLLNQFINYSQFYSDIKIFGVSAQGGDFNDQQDTERLKKINVPSKRIKVVNNSKSVHDLTVPIKWLISE